MRKILIMVLAVAVFACTQKPEGFKIDVKLKGAEGKVLLEKRGKGEWISIDTANIVNGAAVLEGAVKEPGQYYLSVVGQRRKTVLFVENAVMTVTGHADSLDKVVVTGSLSHDEYNALNNQLTEVSKEAMKLYPQIDSAQLKGDTVKAKQMIEEVDKLYEKTNTMREDFIKSHPASYVTPYMIAQVQYGKEAEELEALVGGLDPKLDSFETVLLIK